MSEIVRFPSVNGSCLVEVNADDFGVEQVSRDSKGIVEATVRLEDAIQNSSSAIGALIASVRQHLPDEHEIEFGIKLNAEAGAVIAKTGAEAHFVVRLKWSAQT